MENNGMRPNGGWRETLYEIIYEADTPLGKAFDIGLILSILASVLAVMLDSVASINQHYGRFLYGVEWFFTITFSIEYVVRLICVRHPILYARSFFGVVDLLAVLPTYVSMFFPGAQYLLVIRVLRVLRVFRVLKFVRHLREATALATALKESSRKITVFLITILSLVVILGSLEYLIEGEQSGFTSIPRSVYWAIVTLTTVGYGDISPQSPLGQALAAVIMILGYSIIAVPTGIVSVEVHRAMTKEMKPLKCGSCGKDGHDSDADFCKFCGAELHD
jgi:voltage-gated potassium channel